MSIENPGSESDANVTITRRVAVSIASTAITTTMYSGSVVAQSTGVSATFNGVNSAGVLVFKRESGYASPTKQITGNVSNGTASDFDDVYIRLQPQNSTGSGERLPVEFTSKTEFEAMWNTEKYSETKTFTCTLIADGNAIGSVDLRFEARDAEESELNVQFDDAENGVITFEWSNGFESPTRVIAGELTGDGVRAVEDAELRIRPRGSSGGGEVIPVDVEGTGAFEVMWNTEQYTEAETFTCEFVRGGDVVGDVVIKFDAQTRDVEVMFDDVEDGVIEFTRESDSDSVKEFTGVVRGGRDGEVVIRELTGNVVTRLPVRVNSNNEFRVEWELEPGRSYDEFVAAFVVDGDVVEEVDVVFTRERENAVTYENKNSGGVVKIERGDDVSVSGVVRYVTSDESYVVVQQDGEVVSRESVAVTSSGEFTVGLDTREYPNGRVELQFYHGGDMIDSTKGVVIGSERSAERNERGEKKNRGNGKGNKNKNKDKDKSWKDEGSDVNPGQGKRGSRRNETENGRNRSVSGRGNSGVNDSRGERGRGAEQSEGVGDGNNGGQGSGDGESVSESESSGVGSVLDSLLRFLGN